MNRRDFFKSIGYGAGGFLAFLFVPKKTVEPEKPEPDEIKCTPHNADDYYYADGIICLTNKNTLPFLIQGESVYYETRLQE